MNRNYWSKRIGTLIFMVPVVFAIFEQSGWSQILPFSVTRIIPQIVVGSFDGGLTKYSTVIQIVNPNAITVTVSGSLFNKDGTRANVQLTANSTSRTAVTIGSLIEVTLDPNKVLVINVETPRSLTAPGTVVWASFVTSSPVSYAAYVDLRDVRTNALRSSVVLPASPNNIARFLIPRVRNTASGRDTGFALVNSAVTSAFMTVTLKDAAGATVALRNITVNGMSQLATFTRDFFELTNEPGGTQYQYIVFDAGTAAQFAAIAIDFEGVNQSSVPIEVLPER
jgi:hypothetical protein